MVSTLKIMQPKEIACDDFFQELNQDNFYGVAQIGTFLSLCAIILTVNYLGYTLHLNGLEYHSNHAIHGFQASSVGLTLPFA